MLPEGLIDGEADVAFGVLDAHEVAGPEQQVEVEGGTAEVQEADDGFRGFEDSGVLIGYLREDGTDQLGIRTVGHPHPNVEAGLALDVAPVDDVLADELGVRNEDDDVVARFDGCGTGTDLAHGTDLVVGNLDYITYHDATLKEDDDATNQVIKGLL